MTLAMQTRRASDSQRALLRRSSQNSTSSPSSPVVEAVDFCRSKPRLVELEKQLYYLANGDGNLQEVMKTCQSLLSDCDSVNGIFSVFCSCSWVDRYCEPVISQLFYELVSSQHASSNGTLLLTELETACEELLKVLTHLGTPNTLQFNVVSLLYNLSRLSSLPSSHQEAVQSYLEEIARALWPYSKPSAPNLWANEAFCDAQCDILKACGKVLEKKCPVNTERTFQMIIGKLVSGDISKYSRFRLLEIRELRSSGWNVPVATMNYYKESYLKFINQSRKDRLLSEVGPSSKNELKMANPLGQSKNHETNLKPVTVVRITEKELWKSCEDMQEELLTQEAMAEEKNAVMDDESCLLVDCTDRLAKLKICDEVVRDKQSSNVSYSMGNPFLYRTDLEKAQQPGSSDEDGGGTGVRSTKEEEGTKYSKNQISSQDFTEDNLRRATSPSNSDGSDEVFADTNRPASTEINAVHKNKVLPALHRGEFKKPRRPFKSDSSLTSRSESVEAKITLLDTKESSCYSKSALARSHSEVTTAFEDKNISCELTTETDVVVVPVLNGIEGSKVIVSNESKVANEQDHSTRNVTESWRERKLPSTDNSLGDQNGERSVKQNWRERKLPFSTAIDSDSQEHKNGLGSVVQNWREQPSVDLKESESYHSNDASNENWSERKPSFNNDSQEHKNGPSSVIHNWRERPAVDLKESGSNHSKNASTENWRERNSDNLGDICNKGSHHLNWRDRKSISVDESRKDAACNPSFGGRSKRHSTGDIQLVRQDSNEKVNCSCIMRPPLKLNTDLPPKGKHSAGGGFGLPRPSGQEDQTLTPSDELPLQELHEVQITEEESQGLKGWKLGEIKHDTGCRVFHNRDKCVIEIRGDPQQCKVAKNRVYSVIAAAQEEFGALVPLSDEVIGHLQMEGCNVLAERLALFSGASVKMINDTQLFISGYRNSVNLAKAQLAKIKVMLRYTDDPDVQSPSQQNSNEEKYQLVEKLFSALEEKPRRATDPGCTDQATLKESLSRDFLLSCALSPVTRQRPAGLSLDRTEDWVKDIVLVNGRRGEQAVLERKGFGLPTFDSRPPSS